ncbi:LacI family DNA-binding transcriptional regulator [Ruegeria sediminis]|uniref:LacI family DNA-binding transcriptional regulator n=1 Tax=Ruegeria sediminis TaxID=2583820 RepID=A0ABY2WTB2_9RHOB|nr:LacI family DNA-binding transcriptional regulator [Ruegeria sediminis]TMV04299.1 LacI family DNA-binding transcriptional regulator [Ruegeria sediminis]
MKKRTVLRDVAQLAGVSEMTASRALRDAPDVSEATREKVREIAERLGYVPNRIAGALSSRSSNLVGVVVPSLSSFVFPEVLAGISQGLKDSPLKPVVSVTGYDLDEEEGVIRELLSWRPSGLIVAGLEHTDAARAMLGSAGCPVVEIMDTDGEPVEHCVGISHLDAGREMAETLLGCGYRKIGFIGTKMARDFRAQKRLSGFVERLKQSGHALADQELYDGQSSIETGRDLTARMLERSRGLDCIYYSSDVMSVGGYMHCLASGLEVPRDIALAGFNDLQILRGLPLELATTDAHRFEIGEAAAEIVLTRQRQRGDAEPVRKLLHPTVSKGNSLAPKT